MILNYTLLVLFLANLHLLFVYLDWLKQNAAARCWILNRDFSTSGFTFSPFLLSLDESRFRWIIWRKFTGLIFAFIHVTIFSNGTTVCLWGVGPLIEISSIFFPPLPASFTDGRLSLSVVQQCHLAGRNFLSPLSFILFHLFYGRGWGKHNSVGMWMALSSPHQEPGNREEEREC